MIWLGLIVVALGAARFTLAITRDDIFEPLRQYIFMRYPPENDDHRGWFFQNFHPRPGTKRDYVYSDPTSPREVPPRKPHVIGEMLSCPDCTGFWVAVAAVGTYALAPSFTFWLSLPFAISMVTSLLARRY